MTNRVINAATQLGRVIAIMLDGRWRTLRDIERECWIRFGHADTQAAISARLREVGRMGFEKQAQHRRINEKQVWFYSISKGKEAA